MTYHTQYRIWQNSLYSLGTHCAAVPACVYYLPATLVLLCHLVMPVATALFFGGRWAAGYVPFWLYLLLPLLAGSLLCLPLFFRKGINTVFAFWIQISMKNFFLSLMHIFIAAKDKMI